MENPHCNLCGSAGAELVVEGGDRLCDVPGTFRLVQCTQCGLIYLNPRPSPSEIGQYYPSNYFPFVKSIDEETSWLRRLDRSYGLSKKCKVVTSHARVKTGRLLDVGCATGIFLDGMRKRGWDVQGVELSAVASAYARERMGLPVFTGDLLDTRFPDQHFDAVCLWDVLEHVYDPKRTLQELWRIMRPGSVLALTLPDPSSWERNLFGRYWIGWDIPRHLHLFTPAVLARLLSETGFRLDKRLSITGRYHTFVLSIELLLKERMASRAAQRLILRVLRSWPLRIPALGVYRVTDRIRPSSIVTVLATRL